VKQSTKTFFGLVATYAVLAAASIYFPQINSNFVQQSLPAAKSIMALAIFGVIIIAYGGLGFLGLKLASKISIPDILDKSVSNKQRFVLSGIAGAACGIILIIADNILNRFNGIGHFAHPDFPVSILAAISAAIGEEIIFRLFFISFWTWLISKIILRGKFQNKIFWAISVFSAIAFGIAHYPAIMYLYGFSSFAAMPLALHAELIALNGLIGIVAAYFYKKSGYLGAVSVHLWADIIWHVFYGFFV